MWKIYHHFQRRIFFINSWIVIHFININPIISPLPSSTTISPLLRPLLPQPQKFTHQPHNSPRDSRRTRDHCGAQTPPNRPSGGSSSKSRARRAYYCVCRHCRGRCSSAELVPCDRRICPGRRLRSRWSSRLLCRCRRRWGFACRSGRPVANGRGGHVS